MSVSNALGFITGLIMTLTAYWAQLSHVTKCPLKVNNSLLDNDQYYAFLKIVIGKSILIDFFKNCFYEDRYDIRLKIYFWYI